MARGLVRIERESGFCIWEEGKTELVPESQSFSQEAGGAAPRDSGIQLLSRHGLLDLLLFFCECPCRETPRSEETHLDSSSKLVRLLQPPRWTQAFRIQTTFVSFSFHHSQSQ